MSESEKAEPELPAELFPVLVTDVDHGRTREWRENDVVLFQVKGHQAWPGRLVNWRQEYPSKEVLHLRPRGQRGVVLVKFFQENSYAWAEASELFKLTKTDLEAQLVKVKKEPKLKEAYEIALGDDWIIQDMEERQERLAAKIALAKERKANPQLKLADEDDAAHGTRSSKRRRVSFQDTEYSPSSIQPPRPVAAPVKREGPKLTIKKRQPHLDSPLKTPSTPGITAEAGIAQCSRWRHQLQKSFLSKRPLSELEPERMDALFTEIETFDHHFDWLVASKLPKIFKHISMLQGDIPHEEAYRFRLRAHALVENWKILFFANHPSEGGAPMTKEDSTEKNPSHLPVLQAPNPLSASAPLRHSANGLSASQPPTAQRSNGSETPHEQTSDERSKSSFNEQSPACQATLSDSSIKSTGVASTRSDVSVTGADWPPRPSASSAYPSPVLTARTSSVEAHPSTLADLLDHHSPDLSVRVVPILNQNGLHDISDLYIFSPESWRKFCASRLSPALQSAALEFCLNEAVEQLLEDRRRRRTSG